jgi:hypothetical protein
MSAGCRTIHARYFAITLAARSVATDDERIAPFAGAADIDAIRRRASANLPDVENLAHGSPPFLEVSLERAIKRPVEFCLVGNRLSQLCLHSGTLPAREVAAPQLGPLTVKPHRENHHARLGRGAVDPSIGAAGQASS